MEVLEQNQDQSSNQSLPTEGGEAAPPPAAPAAEPQKSLLDKIKEKGSVAPSAAPEQPAAPAAPTYKPNLKFKAAGKELDVPELLKGLIKDQDSEKYIHSLLSKAHGIEMIQEKLKGAREARDQAHQAYTQVMQPIQYAREAYGRGDLDTVFSTLKIDPNKVLHWAYNKVQLSQMPPDQRQVHEAREAAERRAWELERKAQEEAQSGQSAMGEQINQMLDLVLERQDIAPIAQAFDERMQKAGKKETFRDVVYMMGNQEFSRSGKIISPVEAAKMAVDFLGGSAMAPAQPAPAAPAPVANQAPAPAQKVVLPNAGSAKAASPAKSKVRSIDDLRKLHQKMANA